MRLSTAHRSLSDKDVRRVMNRLVGIVGKGAWERNAENWKKKRQHAAGPISEDHVDEQHYVTRIVEMYLHAERRGKNIWKERDIFGVASKANVLCRVYQELNDVGQKKIRRTLETDPNSDGFWFEVQTATHFLVNGFDVEFADLQQTQSTTFDLLISKSGRKAEVECKSKNYDAGKNITRDTFYRLVDFVVQEAPESTDGLALLYRCASNLPKNDSALKSLAVVEPSHLTLNWNQMNSGSDCVVSARKFPLPSTVSRDSLLNVVRQDCGPESQIAIMMLGKKNIVVLGESQKAIKTSDAIYRDLKTGSRQFSGSNPGFLACHVEAVRDEEWQTLIANSGLGAIAGRLLDSPDRQFLDAVMFSSGYLQRRFDDRSAFGAVYPRTGGLQDSEK